MPSIPRFRSGSVALAGAAITGVVAFVLFLAGGALLWANGHYKDADGYFNTGSARFESTTHAMVTDDLDVGRLSRGRYGTIRLEARGSDKPVFIGVARTRDVDAYLAGVSRERVNDVEFSPFRAQTSARSGARTPARPAAQDIWAASGSGRLTWPVEGGNWTVVLMNADGSPGVSAALTAGARVPAILSLAWSILALGLAFVLATAMLTLYGTRPAPRRIAVPA